MYSFPPILTQKVSGRSFDKGVMHQSDGGHRGKQNARKTKMIDRHVFAYFDAGIRCIKICMIQAASLLHRVSMLSIYVWSRKKERCGCGKKYNIVTSDGTYH